MPLDSLLNLSELLNKSQEFYFANKSYCDFVYATSLTGLWGIIMGFYISRDDFSRRTKKE